MILKLVQAKKEVLLRIKYHLRRAVLKCTLFFDPNSHTSIKLCCFSVRLLSFLVDSLYEGLSRRYQRVFPGGKRQTKNYSKNGQLEVSLAFHSKDI